MAQLFSFIFSFFKRKENSPKFLIEFNQLKLQSDFEKLSINLFECREDPAISVFKKYAEKMAGSYMLELSRVRAGYTRTESIAFYQGSIRSLAEVLEFIAQSTDVESMKKYLEEKKGKKVNKRPELRLTKNQDIVI